jgi:hypothetical protein
MLIFLIVFVPAILFVTVYLPSCSMSKFLIDDEEMCHRNYIICTEFKWLYIIFEIAFNYSNDWARAKTIDTLMHTLCSSGKYLAQIYQNKTKSHQTWLNNIIDNTLIYEKIQNFLTIYITIKQELLNWFWDWNCICISFYIQVKYSQFIVSCVYLLTFH